MYINKSYIYITDNNYHISLVNSNSLVCGMTHMTNNILINVTLIVTFI